MTSAIWWHSLLGYALSGLLGVVGVVIGQRVAARRDDKRWEREKQREDKRTSDEAARRRIDEQRRSAQDFLRTIWIAYYLAINWSAWVQVGKAAGMKEDRLLGYTARMTDSHSELAVALAAVQLHCDEQLSAKAIAIEEYMSRSLMGMLDGKPYDLNKLNKLVEEFVETARTTATIPSAVDPPSGERAGSGSATTQQP